MPEGSQEELSAFQQDAKAIDPKVLATAMGGIDEPPEEPLLSTFEEGHGYFTAAAVGRSLRQYEFVRKVRMCGLPRLNLFWSSSTVRLGCFFLCVARAVSSS